MRRLALFAAIALAAPAHAFDPITSIVGKGISTALDVRSKDDVKRDVEIDATLTKKLLEHKGDEFKDVSVLVFARHATLVGFVHNDEVKQKAEALVKSDKRLRSLKNDIMIGKAEGSLAANALLDKKIDLALTAAKDVHSVNLRWKVYGGEVFLAGVAQNQREIDLATKTIKGLDGVKRLHASLRIGKK